jgi:DNA repair exonuclease SbcCD ATPase subunit
MASKQAVAVSKTESSQRFGSQVQNRVSSYEQHSSHEESTQLSGVRRISSYESNGSTAYTNGSTAYTNGYSTAHTNGLSLALKNGSSTSVVNETSLLITSNVTIEEEKVLFGKLNDRLAKYVEIVRSLGLSREDIDLLISQQRTTETTMKERLESLYVSRINDSNHQNEQLRVENARLTAELNKARSDYEKQCALVAKLELDFRRTDEERRKGLVQIEELTTKIRSTELRIKEFERTIVDVKSTSTGFQKTVDDIRIQYEQEAKKTAQWESKYWALQKEFDLAQASHSTMMESYRRDHIVEIDKIQGEYDAQLVAELQALRADFERRLEANNLEISRLYQIDLSSFNIDFKSHVADVARARKEVIQYREKVHELEAMLASQEEVISGLRRQVVELESLTHIAEDEGVWKRSVATLVDELNEKRLQYSRLLSVHTQLITELNAYHILLTGEEIRLKISRVDYDEHTGRSFVSKGHSDVDVVIDEINMTGNYIHLTNKGTKAFHMDSWMLQATAGNETRRFKFLPNQVIAAGASMTIWSPNRGGTHNPPDSYIMQKVVWPSGDKIRAELLDQNERKKAWLTAYYEVDSPTEYKSFEDSVVLQKTRIY